MKLLNLVRCGLLAAGLVCIGPAAAMDNNQTIEGQCAQKTGGGWEGAGFRANWAYGTCAAMGGDFFLGAAQEIGKIYDDEFGDVTFYKNPQNQKEYYVQKTKAGQFRLGLGNQFMLVPHPPAGKLFLPKFLVNPQPGPMLNLADLQAKQQAKLMQSGIKAGIVPKKP